MAKTTKQTPDVKPKATKKKTSAHKKVTKKVEAQKAPTPAAPASKATAKKAVAKKAAPAKKVAKKSAAKKATPHKATVQSAAPITPRERHDMVAQAAYYISESQGFLGDAAADWAAAEAEVDARLAKAGIKVQG